MRLGWAILGGLLLGGGLAWWLGRGGTASPAPARAPSAQAHAVRPWLYRWHDQAGVLHVSDTPPPAGQPYQRLPVDGRGGDRVSPVPARR